MILLINTQSKAQSLSIDETINYLNGIFKNTNSDREIKINESGKLIIHSPKSLITEFDFINHRLTSIEANVYRKPNVRVAFATNAIKQKWIEVSI